LSSRPIPRNVEVKIYKTITLPLVLCECETWSLILREEDVSEQGSKENVFAEEEWINRRGGCTMRSFIFYLPKYY
jgi:hypothetical protein